MGKLTIECQDVAFFEATVSLSSYNWETQSSLFLYSFFTRIEIFTPNASQMIIRRVFRKENRKKASCQSPFQMAAMISDCPNPAENVLLRHCRRTLVPNIHILHYQRTGVELRSHFIENTFHSTAGFTSSTFSRQVSVVRVGLASQGEIRQPSMSRFQYLLQNVLEMRITDNLK